MIVLTLMLGIKVSFMERNNSYKHYKVLSVGGNKSVTEAVSASNSVDRSSGNAMLICLSIP